MSGQITSREFVYPIAWRNENRYLQRTCDSLPATISRIFGKFLEWMMRGLGQGVVLLQLKNKILTSIPQRAVSSIDWKSVEAALGDEAGLGDLMITKSDIKTPDEYPLTVVHYQVDRHVEQIDSPTIVCFNDGRFPIRSFEFLLTCGFNIIVFDHRTNVKSAGDLLLDGESVIQTAIDHFGIAKKNLHFAGMGVGAQVCAQLATKYPEARVLNINSFIGSRERILSSPEFNVIWQSNFSRAGRFFLPLIKRVHLFVLGMQGYLLKTKEALIATSARTLFLEFSRSKKSDPTYAKWALNGHPGYFYEITTKAGYRDTEDFSAVHLADDSRIAHDAWQVHPENVCQLIPWFFENNR